MTAAQLIGLCRRHGFAVAYDPAAGPRLVRVREGAVPPEHLLESLRAGRGKVIAWFERHAGGGPPGPEVCPVCRALVFEPDLCGEVCAQAGDRGGLGRCPFRESGQ